MNTARDRSREPSKNKPASFPRILSFGLPSGRSGSRLRSSWRGTNTKRCSSGNGRRPFFCWHLQQAGEAPGLRRSRLCRSRLRRPRRPDSRPVSGPAIQRLPAGPERRFSLRPDATICGNGDISRTPRRSLCASSPATKSDLHSSIGHRRIGNGERARKNDAVSVVTELSVARPWRFGLIGSAA